MDAIRRCVSIPRVLNGKNVIALIEVGGKLFSKDNVYQKFFEHGLAGVEADIVAEIKKKGGTKSRFDELLLTAEKKTARKAIK